MTRVPRPRVLALAAAAAAALLGSCEVRSTLFCGKHMDDPRCAGAISDGGADGASAQCASGSDCTAPGLPACELPQGTCVACIDDTTCGSATPVCDLDAHACRACAAHADCPSHACLDSGECADPSQVAFVQMGGTGSGACSFDAPCPSAVEGVASGKPYVRLLGASNTKTLTLTQPVTFLGDPGTSALNGTDATTMIAMGGVIEIEDVALTNATKTTGVGVSIPLNSSAQVTITRCTLTAHDGGAVVAEDGAVTISRSVIASNTGGGLILGSVSRSVVLNIVNNFIVRNGAPGTLVGGAEVRPGSDSVFQFNTIVDNMMGGTAAAGVTCLGTFVASNNIIVHNASGGSNGDTSGCSYGNSLVGATVAGLVFRDQTGAPEVGYHLEASSSAAIDHGTGSATTVDFDGQSRPNGSASDIGADEYYAQ